MDEKVRKSWELAPDQVQIKNPLWKAGMDTLSEIIAGRLGYKGVSMQCKLYKLLLYGEGGHFVKHQDTEKEDGMVATLVVQPPSEHKGGNLVVYRGGKAVQRHDFGKKDGTAAYLSHYAVHYADAEHALEKVTKGYRLALVFSICLPPNMHHLIRNHDIPLSEELAAAMGRLNSDTDSFALMFSHEYTEQSITDLGTRALKGIDRARVEALEEANAILPDEKKLYFYLAELTLDANFYDTGGDWEESERDESINWYSTSGESLGSGMDEIELNFLNPGRESLAELWKDRGNSTFEGYLGNEGATRNTAYSRYVIIAWPAVKSVENGLKYINASAALAALKAQKSVDVATLRSLMTAAANANLVGADDSLSLGWRKPKSDSLSVEFSRALCELLVSVRDPQLVNVFFSTFFNRLEEKESVIPSVVKIVRVFKWSDIAHELLSSLDERIEGAGFGFMGMGHVPEPDDSGMKIALRLVERLDAGIAQQTLLKVAVEKAVMIRDERLCSSHVIGLLWILVLRHGTKSILEPLANKVRQMKPALLDHSIHIFSQHLTGIDPSDEKFILLVSIAAVRIEWLKKHLLAMEKPFSWKMPSATFPENAQIQAFLRGPKPSMTTHGVLSFTGLPDARKYATKCMRSNHANASFTMEPGGRGKDSFVTVTKTRYWFSEYENGLLVYKDELERLEKRFGERGGGGAQKRARLE